MTAWRMATAAVCTTLPYDAGIFLFPATTPSYWNSLVNNRSRDHYSANQNSYFLGDELTGQVL